MSDIVGIITTETMQTFEKNSEKKAKIFTRKPQLIYYKNKARKMFMAPHMMKTNINTEKFDNKSIFHIKYEIPFHFKATMKSTYLYIYV